MSQNRLSHEIYYTLASVPNPEYQEDNFSYNVLVAFFQVLNQKVKTEMQGQKKKKRIQIYLSICFYFSLKNGDGKTGKKIFYSY